MKRLTNFMVAYIKGLKPKDELEAALAAQMAALHVATMTAAERFAISEGLPQLDSAERAYNKLGRTYLLYQDTLSRNRRGGEQKVTVHYVDKQIVNTGAEHNHRAATESAVTEPLALTHSKVEPMPILNEPVRSPAPVRRKRT